MVLRFAGDTQTRNVLVLGLFTRSILTKWAFRRSPRGYRLINVSHTPGVILNAESSIAFFFPLLNIRSRQRCHRQRRTFPPVSNGCRFTCIPIALKKSWRLARLGQGKLDSEICLNYQLTLLVLSFSEFLPVSAFIGAGNTHRVIHLVLGETIA